MGGPTGRGLTGLPSSWPRGGILLRGGLGPEISAACLPACLGVRDSCGTRSLRRRPPRLGINVFRPGGKRVSTGLDVNVNVNAFRRVCFGPF